MPTTCLRPRRPRPLTTGLVALTTVLSGCAAVPPAGDPQRLSVVTTTGILADLTRQVAGEHAEVHSLVPEGGDPHSYEPSLRDVRHVAYADLAFSNYVLLEGRAVIRALDANLRPGVRDVALAEAAVKYAAEIIPLVEDASLDTIWLGLRARGTGEQLGATRSSDVRLRAVDVQGPGELYAYITETFGTPAFSVDTSDGLDERDTTLLPPDAHTHMSWAFTAPGVYRLTVAAELAVTDEEVVPLGGPTTFTFAVGVDPHTVIGAEGATVLRSGHADIAVDTDTPGGDIYLWADPEGGGDHTQRARAGEDVVIEVPNRALHEIPGEPAYRFLGRAGDQVHQLPQAVLGRHVHGEIDPHLWQDVRNAQAYVEIIRDELVAADPAHAEHYRANASRYLEELVVLDDYVRDTIAAIPPSRRHLVTTHDAFGYLGAAYDIDIAGFVTPNPSTEPSVAERRRLVETIDNLDVGAVFLEPTLMARSSTLTEVAGELGVQVCPIYGDAFDDEVTSYTAMMRANADSLRRCLE